MANMRHACESSSILFIYYESIGLQCCVRTNEQLNTFSVVNKDKEDEDNKRHFNRDAIVLYKWIYCLVFITPFHFIIMH